MGAGVLHRPWSTDRGTVAGSTFLTVRHSSSISSAKSTDGLWSGMDTPHHFVGVHESAIWIHDPSGERSMSSEEK